MLQKAIAKADQDVARAKRDADEKKWRIVADQMKLMKVAAHLRSCGIGK